MTNDKFPYQEHLGLLYGRKILPCPFCGEMPYVSSCDRLINIGCEECGYHRSFHGLVQSVIETPVVITRSIDTGEPIEWYDKDAYVRALYAWNERKGEGKDGRVIE